MLSDVSQRGKGGKKSFSRKGKKKSEEKSAEEEREVWLVAMLLVRRVPASSSWRRSRLLSAALASSSSSSSSSSPSLSGEEKTKKKKKKKSSVSKALEVYSWSEETTGLLARCLAKVSGTRKGDCVFLHGKVGSGKSVFCRHFVREVTGNDSLAVNSPTYLLHETYDVKEQDLSVQHFDLYRFNPERQLEVMLQRAYFDECLKNDVVLIEWPENLPDRYKDVERLVVSFSLAPSNGEEEGEEEGLFNEAGQGRRIKLLAEGEGSTWGPVVEALRDILTDGGSKTLHIAEKKDL